MKKFLKLSTAILLIGSLITGGVLMYRDLYPLGATGANRTYVQAKNTTSVKGDWSLAQADINSTDVYGRNGSDTLTAVASPTAADGHDGRSNQALTFNGSTQYLTQKVHDTQQGTLTASMVADTAFINDSGQDFTPYVGVAGASKPYMLVATDSGGLKAWGYIGEQGTGETLGDDILGGIGAFTSWSGDNPSGWSVTEDANNYFTQNPIGQCQMVGNDTFNSGMQVNSVLTAGNLVKYSLDIKSISGVLLFYNAPVVPPTFTTSGIKTGYYTTNLTGFYIDPQGTHNITIDDLVAYKVLTPTTNGVKIYSTKTGSTQSWANVEDGFNANSISSYEIRKTDFQMEDTSFTISLWYKFPSGVNHKWGLGKGDVWNSAGYGISTWGFEEDDPIVVSMWVNDGAHRINVDWTALNRDTWGYFTVVVDRTSGLMKSYINGVFINQSDIALLGNISNGEPFQLGKMSVFFSGSIDEPFVMNVSLTADQVLNLYNSQKRTLIQAQNQTGLVGQWSLSSADYADPVVYGKGISDQLTAVSSPTLTTGFDGRANQALTFDGSTDYLTQKVHDTQQGTLTASMVAGTAFINDSGQDFTPYVGVAGASKPYMLVATDSAGKKAWGYIGEQGTGETLGGESVTNGDFSAWTGDNPDGWSVTEDVNNYIIENAQKCRMVSDNSILVWLAQSPCLISGLHKYSININSVSGSMIGTNLYGETYIPGSVLNSVGVKTGYFTSNVASIFGFHQGSACDITFDDVSIKQVLTPTTSGVKIYSTKTGSTQSWANVETGFNANAVSSYEIRKTDFQITGALTVGAWVKAGSQTSKFILSKYDTTSNYRAYGLWINGDQYPTFSISSDGTSTNLKSAIGTEVITDNLYHFVVGVFTPSTSVQIYVDGVLKNANTTSIPATIFDTSRMLLIGAFQAAGVKTGFFTGSIDEPFIYEKSLTATEILNLYNSQKHLYIN